MADNWLFEHRVPEIRIAGSEQRFPVHRVYCVGQNYAAHAIEMGANPERENPFFFSKPADAIHQSSIIQYPGMTQSLHHEVECVVCLCKGGYQLAPEQTEDLIYGYTVGVDLTRRDLQAAAKSQGRPWDTSKGFDQAAPVADITPKSDWLPKGEAVIQLKVNNQLRQSAQLNQLIWSIPELLAELSCYYQLAAGDVIFTGTPAGVGELMSGDSVVASIEGLNECQFKIA